MVKTPVVVSRVKKAASVPPKISQVAVSLAARVPTVEVFSATLIGALVEIVGTTPSTKWLLDAAIARWVIVTASPPVSVIDPEFRASELAVIEMPVRFISVDCTVYAKTRLLVPLPELYERLREERPTIGITGVPVTVTASVKATVTLMLVASEYVRSAPAFEVLEILERLAADFEYENITIPFAPAAPARCN
jgi:hypothetical protein